MAAILLCSYQGAQAGGYFLSGVGDRARAMGGAFTGLADDWSAAFYNPGGAAFMSRSEIYFGTAALSPRITYTPNLHLNGWDVNNMPPGDYYNVDKTYWVPQIGGYATLPAWGTTLGLAFYAQADMSTSWDLFNPYYRSSTYFPATDSWADINIWTAQPTIGFQAIRDRLSFGAGLIVNRTLSKQMRVHLVPDPGDPFGLPPYPAGVAFVDQTIDGDGWGVGFNLGTLAKLDGWQFGVSFQSEIKHKLSGTTTTNFWAQKVEGRGELGDPLIEQDLLTGKVHKAVQDIDFETTLPPVLTFGLALLPAENFRLVGDFAYTWYSQVPGIIVTTNDDVTFKFGDPQDVNTTVTVSASQYYQWEDQWRVSVGAEWDAMERLHLRGGFYYEPTIVDASTLTPLYWDISNKLSPSVGVSFDIGQSWVLAYSYGAVFQQSRTAETWTADNLPGDYSGVRHENYFSFQVKF